MKSAAKHSSPITALLAVATLLCFTAPAAATTFVMVADEDLVDQSPVVVEARVLTKEPAPAPGTPSTDYLIEVERVIKGDVPGSNLVVRVPGGERPDGIGLKIWGAPSFTPGERVLLFIAPHQDGTFGVRHLMLGAFHEARLGGERVLVRNLAEAHEVAMPGEPQGARDHNRGPRAREAFVDWLADRARGIERPRNYAVEAPAGEELQPISAGFTLFESNGNNLRWFAFDSGQVIRWQVHEDGMPGLTINQLIDALGQGLAVWSADPGTTINYGFRSQRTTSASGGLTSADGSNVLLFGNPNNNQSFEGDFSCASGGVLAIGGPWFARGPMSWNGNNYLSIGEADIITNVGIECYVAGARARVIAEQLFAHELGHTLGLGHSCGDGGSPSCSSSFLVDDALMRAIIHDDNRGARINNDDRAGICALYRNSSNVCNNLGGGGGGTPPLPPSDLLAELQSPTVALLTWQDNSNDEGGFRLQQKVDEGGFVTLVNTAANVETHTVTGLQPETVYTWRVRAQSPGGNSAYSNEVTLTTPAQLPAAPAGLTATPLSPTVVQLGWTDTSVNEDAFVIEGSSPQAVYGEIGITGPGATGFLAAGLTPGQPYSFRVRSRNGNGTSAASNEASATPQTDTTGTCVAGGDTLCLLDDRFRVQVHWRNQFNAGASGMGQIQTSPVSGDRTGVMSFFNPANIELIVKALDGTPVNGNYWFFYGALSTVEYWITVTDTDTGDSRTYHNPPGELCGLPDTEAFPEDGGSNAAPMLRRASAPGTVTGLASTDPCVADAETLCLADGRFEVKVDWTDQRTLDTGEGKAVTGSEKTGYFWFFSPTNIELVVKILDARTISGNWWVFYGALSDVAYTITVRDSETGHEKSYVNEPGNFCGEADTEGLEDDPQ